MAYRLISTNFYKSHFVRGLKASSKSLYSFIMLDCDGAGIWYKDLQVAGVYVDQNITEDEWQKNFVETNKAIELGGGRFFFPDFIEHQYPKGLSRNNPAHKNFIDTLTSYGLLDDSLKPLRRPFKGSIGIGNSTGNGNTGDKGSGKGGQKKKSFIPPTEQEMMDYAVENEYPSELGSRVHRYYSNMNPPWHDAQGDPLKSWKSKMQSVWFKPENKLKVVGKPETDAERLAREYREKYETKQSA